MITDFQMSGNARPATQAPLAVALASADLPNQYGSYGIRYDFNDGCRITLPAGKWRVQLRDLDTHNVLFDQELANGGAVNSSKRYFLRFGLEVWLDGESVFRHEFNARERNVLIQMELGGIGDHFAWFGQAAAFQEIHGCKLTVRMRPQLVELFAAAYPQIRLTTMATEDQTDYYATYKVCIFYNDYENLFQKSDYRVVGLAQSAAYILGLEPQERKPNISYSANERPITEPYVCIAMQASGQSKYWNNPLGWAEVVSFLKQHGYRVVCIDLHRLYGHGISWNQIPHGAEDQTGNRSLAERARWLKHAAFFVGLSSGLAWLSWVVGTPVVMISGFTHPTNEFYTPYRIINWNVCNSCSNDIRHELNPSDFFWCPRQRDTPRMFECTKLITAEHVNDTIRRIPNFGLKSVTA